MKYGYLEKYSQKKKKHKIQKKHNLFIVLQMVISFPKLKSFQNDLWYSIVDFHTFPKWSFKNFAKPWKMQWPLEIISFKGHFKIPSTKMTLT